MVGIVQGVEEFLMERMNILQFWKAFKDGLKFFAEGLGCEFDFSCVEACWILATPLDICSSVRTSNSANLKAGTDLRR